MSLFPDREQRRANRRPPISTVVLSGVVFGVLIYVFGVIGLAREISVVHAIVAGVLFAVFMGAMSLFFRSRSRRSAA